MARIIAIANQKGGVGKTTTSVNLAACVADAGRRTLLIDADPQGNATSGLGVDKNALESSIYDVFINDLPLSDAVRPTMLDTLRLVPANIELAGAEVELVTRMAREQVLKNALAAVRGAYDFVFIDCPPSLGLLTLNALNAADSVLVPIQCEFFALEGLSQLTNSIRQIKKLYNPELSIEGVLLTMYDGRLNLTVEVAQEIKRFFADKVYATVIPRNVRLSEAPSHGLPIGLYDKYSRGAEAYRAFAQEFLSRQP